MHSRLRWFLAFSAALFIIAAFVHGGLLLSGHEHSKARIAESVIGAVLVLGLVGTLMLPGAARVIGIAALGFALLGVIVGLFTIAVGIGPRTGLDFAIHGAILVVLVVGLLVAWRP
jgi:hypothetical protein